MKVASSGNSAANKPLGLSEPDSVNMSYLF